MAHAVASSGFAGHPPKSGPSHPHRQSRHHFGAVAVTLFFATEAVAGAFAMVWALSGLMHLAPALTLTLYALALPGAFATTAKVAMLAWAAETDPVNNLPAGHVQPATAGFDASKDSHHAD
ncbi:MAG: hypothetical protein R3D65_04360 [Zhengella sp.]|uniref:hypothetical protein n=1 Tax=Zhengella sp. TaxID=2282762 RepID=UPI0035292042